MPAAIAVTGATGKLGGRVARRLERAGVAQRLLVRELGRAPQLAQADAAVADYSDATAAGRVAAVAQDDIADVAALVLQHPQQHTGRSYDLTGPQALTLDEVAATLTRVTGRTVTYEAETVDEAYASRRAFTDSQWQLDTWVSTFTAIATGELDGVSDDVANLTGHPATALAGLLRR